MGKGKVRIKRGAMRRRRIGDDVKARLDALARECGGRDTGLDVQCRRGSGDVRPALRPACGS